MNTKRKTPLWTKNFLFITLINLFIFCGFQMFPSALPPYLKTLGASDHILGWVTGISTIATLLVRPGCGFVLDKFGRRNIFLIGLGIMVVFTAAYGFFPVISIILLVRFVHGIGFGIANTASNTIASDNIARERLGEGMGYFTLSVSLAMAVAPAISLSIGMPMSVWVALFFVSLSFVLALFIKHSLVPESAYPKSGKFSPYEKTSFLPAITVFLVTTPYGGLVTFLALYAAQRGIVNIGAFFTIYAVSMLLTRPPMGKLIDQYGYGAGIWPGVILLSAGLALLSIASSLPVFLICAALYGIGSAGLQTSLQTMSVARAPQGRLGAANATFFTGFDGGIGFGAIIAGLLSTALGYANMYLIFTLCPIMAGVIYFFSQRCNKQSK